MGCNILVLFLSCWWAVSHMSLCAQEGVTQWSLPWLLSYNHNGIALYTSGTLCSILKLICWCNPNVHVMEKTWVLSSKAWPRFVTLTSLMCISYLFIYLAALGLNCSMQDQVPCMNTVLLFDWTPARSLSHWTKGSPSIHFLYGLIHWPESIWVNSLIQVNEKKKKKNWQNGAKCSFLVLVTEITNNSFMVCVRDEFQC